MTDQNPKTGAEVVVGALTDPKRSGAMSTVLVVLDQDKATVARLATKLARTICDVLSGDGEEDPNPAVLEVALAGAIAHVERVIAKATIEAAADLPTATLSAAEIVEMGQEVFDEALALARVRDGGLS